MEHIFLISETLGTIGGILIAYTALRVHHRVRKEHQIDNKVFAEMRREMYVGITGITFLLAGYVLTLVAYLASV